MRSFFKWLWPNPPVPPPDAPMGSRMAANVLRYVVRDSAPALVRSEEKPDSVILALVEGMKDYNDKIVAVDRERRLILARDSFRAGFVLASAVEYEVGWEAWEEAWENSRIRVELFSRCP